MTFERERIDYAFYTKDNKISSKGAIYTPHNIPNSGFGPEQAESLARVQDGDYTNRVNIPKFNYNGYPDQKTKKEYDNMSTALWCDRGNHAFSINDKQRQKMVLTEIDPDSGEEVEIRGDVCGLCRQNPFGPPRTNQATIGALEAQAGFTPTTDLPSGPAGTADIIPTSGSRP